MALWSQESKALYTRWKQRPVDCTVVKFVPIVKSVTSISYIVMRQTLNSLKGLNSLTRKGGFKLEGTVFKFCQAGFIFAEFEKTEFRDWNGVEKKAGTGY